MEFPGKVRRRRGKRGFSLVATLLCMVLLMVLAMGMMTLSVVTLRKTGLDNPRRQAEANARIALMMALGELQEHLGPDQRVSGEAPIGAGPDGAPPNRHWLSVWSTTKENGKPWIVRNGDKGGLADERQNGSRDPRNQRLATLVSGNESKVRFDDDRELDKNESVSLVGRKSVGTDADPDEEVRAPLVHLAKKGKRQGSYAWWVGDLGAKANIRVPDASAVTGGDENRSLMLAQDASWRAFGTEEIPDKLRESLVDEPQVRFFYKDTKDLHYHDFTVWSAGLPINVRDGGWKADLTAFLESDGTVGGTKQGGENLPGLSDSDSMVGPANPLEDELSGNPGEASRLTEVAPKFGLLRQWAKRAESTPMSGYEPQSELGDLRNLSTGGNNSKSVDIINRTKSHIMPVLVEGSLFYNLSFYELPTPLQGNPYGLRVHYYPRVVLWNPFNFPVKVPASAILLHINGGKAVEVTLTGGKKQIYKMFWGMNHPDPSKRNADGSSYRGRMYFRMTGATIEPGESLVWSPASNSLYNEDNFGQNLLTTSVGPSPSRSFYQDKRSDNYPLFGVTQTRPPTPGLLPNVASAVPLEWREMVPPKPVGDVQAAKWTQADDYMMSWKPLGAATFNDGTFTTFPMGRFVSCAYQYGDEDELPVEWTSLDPVPFARSYTGDPTVSQLPDRRTRDGFRLRWFRETESNIMGSGSLAGTAHFEDSAIGNWNMRSSFSFRNPFDNVTDVAPNFFGIYTRDLFDGDTDWTNMNPRAVSGRFLGDPFDQPVRGPQKRILFDVPRRGAEIASLGAFQHATLSEFIWHPSYPLGNSLADPRVPMDHTEPDRSVPINRDKGGWNQDSIGYSTDGRSNTNGENATTNDDNWAYTARNYFKPQLAQTQNLVYDLSFELNHSLWDRYFLSTGTEREKSAFIKDPFKSPLPNGRIKPNDMAGKVDEKSVTDYRLAASKLVVEGAFNVNSTSVGAWEALLLSNMDTQFGDKVAFPRFLNVEGGEWDGRDARSASAWSGQRVFTRTEIRRLAEAIVDEVKERGPFISMGDFVNRRLAFDETGRKGALQAAIDRAHLNESFKEAWPLDNTRSLPDFDHPDHIQDATRLDQNAKPETTAWGALGFLTQADLLQFIGPALSARSDTFKIRAYGESRDSFGKVTARAWCEAVVQRSPEYVDPSDDPMKLPKDLNETNKKFGRRFQVVFFRWLKPEEI